RRPLLPGPPAHPLPIHLAPQPGAHTGRGGAVAVDAARPGAAADRGRVPRPQPFRPLRGAGVRAEPRLPRGVAAGGGRSRAAEAARVVRAWARPAPEEASARHGEVALVP